MPLGSVEVDTKNPARGEAPVFATRPPKLGAGVALLGEGVCPGDTTMVFPRPFGAAGVGGGAIEVDFTMGVAAPGPGKSALLTTMVPLRPPALGVAAGGATITVFFGQ